MKLLEETHLRARLPLLELRSGEWKFLRNLAGTKAVIKQEVMSTCVLVVFALFFPGVLWRGVS